MLRTTSDGRGVVTCLELADAQDKPALFSTFMMWLLAELYHNLPEAGDLPKPKLVFFFDEAHLVFDDASRASSTRSSVVRLIRSKGVGVYMVTQTPKDVPDRGAGAARQPVQHAPARPHPNDDKALRRPCAPIPKTEYYDLEETLTSLGIGEAVVTVLDPRGTPTPVVARPIPPSSRMAPLTPRSCRPTSGSRTSSPNTARRWTGRSAGDPGGADGKTAPSETEEPGPRPKQGRSVGKSAAAAAGAAVVGALSTSIGRTVGREIVRGLFGMLGVKPPRTRRSTRSRW